MIYNVKDAWHILTYKIDAFVGGLMACCCILKLFFKKFKFYLFIYFKLIYFSIFRSFQYVDFKK